jgi:RNA polymerase sigma-70 factor (ECF subfamily)
MLRCSGDITLADDLAQRVFLQAWRSLPQLRRAGRFGAWLKRIAISVWLQHQRRNDPVSEAGELPPLGSRDADAGIAVDLDRALANLKPDVRLCIVLAYHEGMTHDEIAAITGIPTGTVKSHIRRGTLRLREQLAAYVENVETGGNHDAGP